MARKCLTRKTSSASMSVKPERTWRFANDATLGANLSVASVTANARLPTRPISVKLTLSELAMEASVVKSATVAMLAWTATSCRCLTLAISSRLTASWRSKGASRAKTASSNFSDNCVQLAMPTDTADFATYQPLRKDRLVGGAGFRSCVK
jgi:hypothetical protein